MTCQALYKQMTYLTLSCTVCVVVCLVSSGEHRCMIDPGLHKWYVWSGLNNQMTCLILSYTVLYKLYFGMAGLVWRAQIACLTLFYAISTVRLIWCKQIACLTGSYTDCFVYVNLVHRKGTFNLMHSKGFSPVLYTLYDMVWYDMSSFEHFQIMFSNRRRMCWLISNAQNCRQAVPGSKPTFQKPRTD